MELVCHNVKQTNRCQQSLLTQLFLKKRRHGNQSATETSCYQLYTVSEKSLRICARRLLHCAASEADWSPKRQNAYKLWGGVLSTTNSNSRYCIFCFILHPSLRQADRDTSLTHALQTALHAKHSIRTAAYFPRISQKKVCLSPVVLCFHRLLCSRPFNLLAPKSGLQK
jgi:hypothetical protein